MAEEDQVFSSKIKYDGIFTFKELYKFCHDWLSEETNLSDFEEGKYGEKLAGDKKEIDVEWTGQRNLSDYFKEKIKVKISVKNMSQVKIKKGGADIDTNKGSVEVSVKGVLVKDYQGKFEMTGFKKFLRATYEKYIIPSTVSSLKEKVASDCNEFLEQTKAFLDLEGKA